MTRLTWRIGATSLVGSALAMVPGVASHGSAPPPPLASGHAEVIAQGLVDFPAGTFHWQVADGSLASGADPTAVPEPVTFVLADAGVVDVTTASASYRLGAGEAAMLPALAEGLLSTTSASATYWTLSIANVAQTEGAGATGGSFSLDAARRDVDLLRDLLTAGETLAIPDSDAPTLVLVTAGSVSATSDSGDSIDLVSGDATTIDGGLTIANDGSDNATVVAAVIGSTIPDLGLPTSTSADPPANTDPSPTSPTPTTGETTTTMSVDTDGDGLSDAEESDVYGTDPNDPDSEDDDLNDGAEIANGSDPFDNDTDDDFYTDADEVNISGTDPTDPDSDDDGLLDSNEIPNDADPNVADTDGDGADDGDEVAAGTDPADPTSVP